MEQKDSQAGGGHKRRSWGSWRHKDSPELQAQSVPSTPLLLAEGRTRHISTDSFTSLPTNDWCQAERVARAYKEVHKNDRRTDATESAELERQSPNSPSSPNSPNSPTGKSSKFQNIRSPSSGKAEEGKRNQVLDYLGGIFGSGRKKAAKQSPAEPSSCVEESPAGSKDLSSSARDAASELLSGASGALVGKEDTSLTPVCVVASVPSDDRSAKEHEAIEFIDVSGDEITSSDPRPLKDGVFVGCDRLREGQYVCESQDQCVDIPPIKEWVLPVSETVRVEHISRPAVLDVSHPKTKANTKLSEASVSLPVNRIGVELKPQGKPRETDQTERSKLPTFRAFRREIQILSAPEKTSLTTPDLVKQQSPSKKVHLSDTTRNSALGTGIARNTHVAEGTTNLLKVNPHPTVNASRQKLNGLVEQDSNAVTGPRPDLGNSKSTVERSDLFLGLRVNSNSSTAVSYEMEKR